MKTLLIILLVTAVLSAILRILRKKHSGHNHPDQLYEVPAGMATQHAAKLLPMIGSEDMSHLLVQLNLAEEVDDNMDSLLNPLVYWVIDLEFRPDVVLKRSDILRAYDQAWFKKFKDVELDIYGYAPELNEWTFVRATGVPEGFTGIRFGVKLFDPIIEPPHRLTRSYLEQILTSIQMQGNTLGLISVRPTIQVEEAAEKSEQLFNIWQECNMWANVVLSAPEGRPFDGKQIWDVMMSLGLKWGDMDLFHWKNDADRGDAEFFSVWTSTSPGYFLPEQIAADEFHAQDLVFGFDVPRCAAPMKVFDSMLAAVSYAQKRLGGSVLDSEQHQLDVAKLRQEIQMITEKLNQSGFPPGANRTLYLF